MDEHLSDVCFALQEPRCKHGHDGQSHLERQMKSNNHSDGGADEDCVRHDATDADVVQKSSLFGSSRVASVGNPFIYRNGWAWSLS